MTGTQLDVFGKVAEQMAAEAARAALAGPRLAAQAARRDHVVAIARGRVQLTEAMRTSITRHLVLGGLCALTALADVDVCEVAQVLGLDEDPWIWRAVDDGDTETVGAAVAARIRTDPDPLRIAVACLLVQHEPLVWDHQWDAPVEHLQRPGGYLDWLHLLGGPLAYEWTPFEADQVDALDAKAGRS